jgi:hypothetical protein
MADFGSGDKVILITNHPMDNGQPRVFVIPANELWKWHRADLDTDNQVMQFVLAHQLENLYGATLVLANLVEDSGT